mgnify:CR=1 FL=1
MAETFLAHGAAALKGGERHQVVIHVDAETLRDSTAGRCQFEHGPSMAAETARRLSCDCSVVPIVEREDGTPIGFGLALPDLNQALGNNRIGLKDSAELLADLGVADRHVEAAAGGTEHLGGGAHAGLRRSA